MPALTTSTPRTWLFAHARAPNSKSVTYTADRPASSAERADSSKRRGPVRLAHLGLHVGLALPSLALLVYAAGQS